MDTMEKRDSQGPDGASIKPVSSLLSHFEGLKSQHKPHRGENKAKDTTTTGTALETPRSAFSVRASLDLPRSASPWNANTSIGHDPPKTPGDPQKGRVSPTRSSHKRPMSMHIQSSPQLTPAVHIESPRSPPLTFFQRSSSRSPDRIDNTPFGKVRELVSQHSSRSSTRPPSPRRERDIPLTKQNGRETPETGASHDFVRSSSPTRQPPPVNRAEKPRIPIKPLGIIQPTVGRLTPEPRRPSMGARISPFSTPPSSNENSPSESPVRGESSFPFPAAANLHGSAHASSPSEPQHDTSMRQKYNESLVHSQPPAPRQSDPRLLGFGALPTVSERKDPRMLGFSNPDHRPSDSSHSANTVPARANTLIERSSSKDPREFGLSSSRPTPRAVSETIRQTPPPRSVAPLAQQAEPIRALPQRDARQFGFSNAATLKNPADDANRPNLPVRRLPQEAPPRPSDTSKPGAKPPIRYSPQHSNEKLLLSTTGQPSKSVVPPPSDVYFPPPPKRSTFNEEQQTRQPLVAPLSRSATFGATQQSNLYDDEDSDEAERAQELGTVRTEYPDATNTNRRPPYSLTGEFEIHTKSENKVFDVCGRYLCITGYVTRIFDMSSGEQIVGINHGDTVKISAARFKPGMGIEDEGKRVWLGNNIGDLQEIDTVTHSVVATSSVHNRREIVRILRCQRSLWTLDDDGKLFVWRADETGTPNLKYSHVAHRTQRGHTFSMVIDDKLWLATGKEIRVYRPGNEAQFSVLSHPLVQQGTGDITSGTHSNQRGGRAYFGHADGKVTIYSSTDYTYISTIKISDYKINGLSFVGDKLWVAYKTGMVYVYDISTKPWKVKKDWRAHQGPVNGMLLDPSSVWALQRLQVVSAGHDNYVKMWDATLEEDWMDGAMQARDVEYCTFRELRASVVTWNVGAISPAVMRSDFIADAIHSGDPPEVLIFGFQEVVDLEDRAVTAKSLLGFAKKKDTAKTEQHQSRIYREWRDYLARCIGRFTDARFSYTELTTSSLIGLFQCVFIRQEERRNVSMLSTTNVKCGMGGHYGNKGALVTRFVVDDSSMCFVNCHLAAGQSHTSHRNNDIATILESETLAAEPNRRVRSSLFTGGGDGTQILDHEICIINGDLNYRIDTMPRDTVIKMIKQNELAKLLERDQIMVSRRRVWGFRLSPFIEMPITFAPTYKYDVNTDDYDTSEKKRSPAWCDRVLYRGPGRVKQLEYRRHEVRVSDHRPVSALFKLRVKRVNVERREKILDECHEQFKSVKKEMAEGVCVRWLVDVMGMNEAAARNLLTGA